MHSDWTTKEQTYGRLEVMGERPASTMLQYIRVVNPMLTSVFLARPAFTICTLNTTRTMAAQNDLMMWISDLSVMLYTMCLLTWLRVEEHR